MKKEVKTFLVLIPSGAKLRAPATGIGEDSPFKPQSFQFSSSYLGKGRSKYKDI